MKISIRKMASATQGCNPVTPELLGKPAKADSTPPHLSRHGDASLPQIRLSSSESTKQFRFPSPRVMPVESVCQNERNARRILFQLENLRAAHPSTIAPQVGVMATKAMKLLELAVDGVEEMAALGARALAEAEEWQQQAHRADARADDLCDEILKAAAARDEAELICALEVAAALQWKQQTTQSAPNTNPTTMHEQAVCEAEQWQLEAYRADELVEELRDELRFATTANDIFANVCEVAVAEAEEWQQQTRQAEEQVLGLREQIVEITTLFQTAVGEAEEWQQQVKRADEQAESLHDGIIAATNATDQANALCDKSVCEAEQWQQQAHQADELNGMLQAEVFTLRTKLQISEDRSERCMIEALQLVLVDH